MMVQAAGAVAVDATAVKLTTGEMIDATFTCRSNHLPCRMYLTHLKAAEVAEAKAATVMLNTSPSLSSSNRNAPNQSS